MLLRLVCALLFLAWTAEPVGDETLFCGLWRSPLEFFSPLFTSLPAVNLTPWQLLILAVTPVGLLWPGSFRQRNSLTDVAVLISLCSIGVTLLWGLVRGGSAYNAYFQLWRFLAGLLVAVVLLSVTRNARDLKLLGFTVLSAAVVRSTLAVYFYWAHVRGRIEPPPPYMTTHDDSLLFVAGLLVSLSWALERRRRTVWIATALLWVHLLYAITLNNRRLAWIELLLGLAFVYLLLPRRPRRRANRWLVLAAPVMLAYVAVGWGRPEPIFAPAKALATAGSDEDASSLARHEEIRNLLYTLSVAGNPVLGTGWGQQYVKFSSVYANFGDEWWQYLYLPHNSLLGVAVFGGLVGVAGIWLPVPVTALLAARGYRGATRPVDRAAAMVALCILPAYGAQCYGDIGFQSFTSNLILGAAVAVAGKVAARAPVRRRDRLVSGQPRVSSLAGA
jgi:hypothetical protein